MRSILCNLSPLLGAIMPYLAPPSTIPSCRPATCLPPPPAPCTLPTMSTARYSPALTTWSTHPSVAMHPRTSPARENVEHTLSTRGFLVLRSNITQRNHPAQPVLALYIEASFILFGCTVQAIFILKRAKQVLYSFKWKVHCSQCSIMSGGYPGSRLPPVNLSSLSSVPLPRRSPLLVTPHPTACPSVENARGDTTPTIAYAVHTLCRTDGFC